MSGEHLLRDTWLSPVWDNCAQAVVLSPGQASVYTDPRSIGRLPHPRGNHTVLRGGICRHPSPARPASTQPPTGAPTAGSLFPRPHHGVDPLSDACPSPVLGGPVCPSPLACPSRAVRGLCNSGCRSFLGRVMRLWFPSSPCLSGSGATCP